MGDNGVGQQLDKSVPVFGGVMGGEQCIIESILAAYIVFQGPGPFPRQTLVVGVGAFGRGVSVNVNMRNDYIGIVFYQVDTALYLCQFGRIVSVFGIDGCFVEREVQIGTSASSRTFLSSICGVMNATCGWISGRMFRRVR